MVLVYPQNLQSLYYIFIYNDLSYFVNKRPRKSTWKYLLCYYNKTMKDSMGLKHQQAIILYWEKIYTRLRHL